METEIGTVVSGKEKGEELKGSVTDDDDDDDD